VWGGKADGKKSKGGEHSPKNMAYGKSVKGARGKENSLPRGQGESIKRKAHQRVQAELDKVQGKGEDKDDQKRKKKSGLSLGGQGGVQNEEEDKHKADSEHCCSEKRANEKGGKGGS